jgi:FKBP-type peptidyl-prolyl cis-trans isomerase 2
MQLIAQNMVVAMRYCMRNSMGDVLEDKMQATPVNYLHGGTEILQALQWQLAGLKAGDKKIVILQKEVSNMGDDIFFDIIIDNVRTATPEEILLGYPLTITGEICDENCVCFV